MLEAQELADLLLKGSIQESRSALRHLFYREPVGRQILEKVVFIILDATRDDEDKFYRHIELLLLTGLDPNIKLYLFASKRNVPFLIWCLIARKFKTACLLLKFNANISPEFLELCPISQALNHEHHFPRKKGQDLKFQMQKDNLIQVISELLTAGVKPKLLTSRDECKKSDYSHPIDTCMCVNWVAKACMCVYNSRELLELLVEHCDRSLVHMGNHYA